MDGAIRKWEILSHPIVTIQCFGWTVFFRAVLAGRNQTFLSLLNKAGIFEHLTRQEREHAELLALCRAAAGRGRWQEACLDRRRESLPETERQLREAEAILQQHHSVADALRLVIQVESSQINQLFSGVVEATDPRLARKLRAFRNAVKDHLQYICQRIPALDPSFSEACRALWAGMSKDRPANSN